MPRASRGADRRRARRRCSRCSVAVAHQDEAGVVGNLAPFVEIEGDGIGPLDARPAAAPAPAPACASAPKAPSTWNHSFSSRAIVGQRRQDRRSRRHRPCRPCRRPETACKPGARSAAIAASSAARSIAKSVVDRDAPQALAAEPGQIHRLATQPWAPAEV